MKTKILIGLVAAITISASFTFSGKDQTIQKSVTATKKTPAMEQGFVSDDIKK
jgi:hypothetical protein